LDGVGDVHDQQAVLALADMRHPSLLPAGKTTRLVNVGSRSAVDTIIGRTLRRRAHSAVPVLTGARNVVSDHHGEFGGSMNDTKETETPPLSRAGRRKAEATLASAQFRPTTNGKRVVRRYEVHGMEIVEWVSVERAEDATK
jgi:hypothetical protein